MHLVRASVIAIAALVAPCTVHSQEKPPLKLLVGFPAGAALDTLSRLMAEKMKVSLNRPVVVENKAGAGGMIAAESLKTTAPDGNTVLMSPVANISIAPHTYSNLRYNALTDFEPVAHIADFQIAFGINADAGATTMKDYVALVKKDPKYGNFASAAAGSLPHFFGLLVARTAGIEMTHVPYKGSAPAMQALAAGEVTVGVMTLPDISTVVKTGKARILAVSGGKRSPLYPDVPTLREAGYNIEGNGWYAMYVPAKTPRSDIEAISKAAIDAIKSPEITQRFASMGLEPTAYGPAETGRITRADYEKWGPVIRASGFKADQ